MAYRVTKQYARGTDIFIKEFDDLNAAKSFVTDKLKEEAALKVKVMYRISEFGDILEEFDSTNVVITEGESSSASQGSRSSTSSFRPTPFNTTPTPPGLPKKWIRDEDENGNDENK